MNSRKPWIVSFILALVMGCLTLSISAQGNSSGTIVLGQPLQGEIKAHETLDYDYTVTQLSQVTLQVLGTTSQPTITILSQGEVIAGQPNTENTPTTTLVTTLDAGSYDVQIGARNNTSGLVIVVLQSETPPTSTPLTFGTPVNGTVSSSAPMTVYGFRASSDYDSYLYLEAPAAPSGITARIRNLTMGQVSAEIGTDFLGTRLNIPASNNTYQVEISQSASGADAPFTLCVATAALGGCEVTSAQFVVQPTPVEPTATLVFLPTTVPVVGCTVSSSVNGSVNIRQSASTSAIILGALPNGVAANVIGISPDRFFYNVLYNGTNGWIALSVVLSSGDCATVPTVNPPSIIFQPTQPPPPTAQPTVQPTLQQPTTQPPSPTPTEDGPCLIKITANTKVYTTTVASNEYVVDELQPGAQMYITADVNNGWWEGNLFNQPAYIETSKFGHGAQVTGDCSHLPIAP